MRAGADPGRAQPRAWARIDTGAVEANAALLKRAVGGDVELCAVVKADAYGHGAAPCAAAAMRGGATRLAVAAASEAEELRQHFPEARLFVMGALSARDLPRALDAGADVAVWRQGFRELCSRLGAERGEVVRVHVKHDSGMGRLGERDPATVLALAEACAADEHLALVGVWTHFATADETDGRFLDEQLAAFSPLAERVRALAPGCVVHAANSAATLRDPRTHFDMVRCGVALYGMDPFQGDPSERGLAPALELRSYVADVKRFGAGASAGYGRSWRAPRETWVGVLPIGYGDGVRRALSNNGEVLVRGRRHPIVGTISMDNLTVDLGPQTEVRPGDEAVLIGSQGRERIGAEQLAAALGTINYEISTGISPRVPRAHEQ